MHRFESVFQRSLKTRSRMLQNAFLLIYMEEIEE